MQNTDGVIRTGDKVWPKTGKGAAYPRVGDSIVSGTVVTVRTVGMGVLMVWERSGIFFSTDFEKVPNGTPVAQSRKTLKKKFERELCVSLEWRDSHLCYAGTDRRIAGSPYVPLTKKPKPQSWRA